MQHENFTRHTGILEGFHRFSEKVGMAQLAITQTSHGKTYSNKFSVTFFSPLLEKIEAIPKGSLVSVEGRLRNSSYEKQGVITWKLDVTATNLRVLKTSDVSPVSAIPF